jgi:uncharacterized protein (DUF302 family)
MLSANLVYRALLAAGLFAFLPVLRSYAADSGLISKPSDHSVQETVERFEKAVKAKGGVGWMVFTVIDHAAAASKNALRAEAAHRDCIWQSQPWHQASGRTPTLAIDVSLRALVWQDDQDKVWLTYNSGLYLRS